MTVFPEQTVAIAVIGVTGSGKSTLINVASGSNLPVGSCTTELQSSTFRLDGRSVTLIDTPGFDDTRPGILEVLKLLSYFTGLYSQGVKLAGVIYMHCITHDHMRNPSGHNFRVFNKFCGGTSLPEVVIVTNEQGHADKNEFFGPAITKGARMLYHDGSQASAHAILRHLLHRENKFCPSPKVLLGEKSDPSRTTTEVVTVCDLTGEIEHRTKACGELRHRPDTETPVENETARKILQDQARGSLEKVERIRYDLERTVSGFATENSRLEDENRCYKNNFTVQKAEAELRMRLLGEERKARELAEAERERAEARLVEERAFWERQKTEMENPREHAGPTYDKVFACGALIFVLLCVSRFALHGSPLLL